jgi:hypothetical protein
MRGHLRFQALCHGNNWADLTTARRDSQQLAGLINRPKKWTNRPAF